MILSADTAMMTHMVKGAEIQGVEEAVVGVFCVIKQIVFFYGACMCRLSAKTS